MPRLADSVCGTRTLIRPADANETAQAWRLAVEAGSTLGWHKYVGDEGAVLGIDTFGHSAPAEELFELFGLTVQNVVHKATQL